MSDVSLQGSFGQDGAPIVESGNNNNWDYVKFADGTFIAHKAITGLGPISTSTGSGFFSAVLNIGNWPFTPITTPRVTCYSGDAGGSAHAWPVGVVAPSSLSAGSVRLARFLTSPDTSFFLQVHAIGLWK